MRRIIILTQGHTEPHAGKTAACIIRYKAEEVVALLDGTQVGKTSGDLLGVGRVPVVAKLDDAPDANTPLLGIAPPGGKIPQPWRAIILDSISRRKMNVVSGLHDFLNDDPELSKAAKEAGVTLQDVRKNSEKTIARRQGLRPDCVRDHAVGFDCIVADFVSGASEKIVLANHHHEILVVEGQGSLVHPSYSGVTLSLLHGCAPQALLLCYEVGRETVTGVESVKIPPLAEIKRIFEVMSNIHQPCKIIGIGINSRRLNAAAAAEERKRVKAEFGLPACDVIRDGPDELVDAVIRFKNTPGWH